MTYRKLHSQFRQSREFASLQDLPDPMPSYASMGWNSEKQLRYGRRRDLLEYRREKLNLVTRVCWAKLERQ